MNYHKISKIISLLINGFVFSSSVTLIFMCTIFGYQSNNGTFAGFSPQYLQYFTTLSNLYNGIISLLVVIMTIVHFNHEEVYPRWLKILFMTSLISVMLTFFTVLLFLAPVHVYHGGHFFFLYNGIDYLLFHLINPLLSLLSYLFFFKGERINNKDLLYSLIPVIIYICIYTPCVLSGVWQDFYGFTFGGKYYLVIIVMPLMLIVTYLIALSINLLVTFLDNRFKK